MSTKGLRDFRPKLHFTAKNGWINDPNGLVFADGVYHLFYQYNPADTVSGFMHWGHAVSKDLISWEHLPAAICPDRFGTIFSGSAVYDKDNTSGLGAFGKAPIVAMYTVNASMGKQHYQDQHIAYSLDGVNFIKYEGNPIMPNGGLADFRDPKAFWNPKKQCWSCVLTVGTSVRFYASPDMKHWEQTGEFRMQDVPSWNIEAPKAEHAEMGTSVRSWECPDLFPLMTPEGEKWVLVASIMPVSHELFFSRTEYFVGDFDGDSFLWDHSFSEAAWVDEGFDNYAGVTFNNTDDRIFVGMGANWCYQWQEPTNEYCGLMTLARRLTLKKTPSDGYRLASEPMGIGSYLKTAEALHSGDALRGETFAMELSSESAFEVKLVNSVGQELRFGVTADNEVYIDRSHAGDRSFNKEFSSPAYGEKKVKRYFSGPCALKVIFDVSELELFADDGTITMAANVFPDTPYSRVYIDGGAAVRFFQL